MSARHIRTTVQAPHETPAQKQARHEANSLMARVHASNEFLRKLRAALACAHVALEDERPTPLSVDQALEALTSVAEDLDVALSGGAPYPDAWEARRAK